MSSQNIGSPTHRLVLQADTATDLMTTTPISLNQDATVAEAAAFLVDKEISAAPVIDEAGRAVGVVSHTDIVRHVLGPDAGQRPRDEHVGYRITDFLLPPAVQDFLRGPKADSVRVRDILTPTILSVAPDDSALTVVAQLLALKVHRLFVIDKTGVLVGVVSTFDVLRKLHK